MYGSKGGGGKVPGYKTSSVQQYTPEQMQLFQSLFSKLGPDSYLSRLAGGDESLFEEMEAPAHRQFNTLQGNLSSRFSGMGMGGRRSSGFQNTANQASSDFAQDLQSKRQGLQSQALRDLMGMSNSLLGQRPNEQYLTPEKPSFLESLLGILGQGMGQLAGGVGAGFGYKNMLGGR